MLRYSLYDEGQIRQPDLFESYSSDNSSAADNQQERLINIGWVTGFVDGEGCFSIHVVRQPHRANRRGYRTGFQVAHQFVVTQGAKSIECLQTMQQHFGVGRVYCNQRYDNHKEHLYQFVVAKRSDLIETIIPFFQRYSLRTAKRLDFERFVACMQIIRTDAHLTPGGLLQIVEIMQNNESLQASPGNDQNPQRLHARHRIQSGEDIVRSAWRHAG